MSSLTMATSSLQPASLEDPRKVIFSLVSPYFTPSPVCAICGLYLNRTWTLLKCGVNGRKPSSIVASHVATTTSARRSGSLLLTAVRGSKTCAFVRIVEEETKRATKRLLQRALIMLKDADAGVGALFDALCRAWNALSGRVTRAPNVPNFEDHEANKPDSAIQYHIIICNPDSLNHIMQMLALLSPYSP